jgi:UDP-glucose 4-epimerase
MVLPRFVEAALRHEPLRVFGDGKQSRCFCYVGDTVEALLRLEKTEQARGHVVNVGSSEEIAIEDLARRVIELTDSKSKIEKIPYDKAYIPGFEDMLRRKPSLEKLAALTGFRPATRLDEIVRRIASKQA